MDRLTKRIGGSVIFPENIVGVYMTPDNDTVYAILNKLAAYEDTGLPPEACANYKTFEDECITKGVTFSRILELMNADAEGRLKIVPRAPKGTVCGSCVHFDRETGTAHGFCKTQTQMRVSTEFPSGKIEPRYVVQSRQACTGYEPLEEDDDGATD